MQYQYINNTTAKSNRRAVEANLRTIDSAIMQYKATNDGVMPTKGSLNTFVKTWPIGPDGVEYDVSDDGRAVISQESTGAWFTTEDESLPINWE